MISPGFVPPTSIVPLFGGGGGAAPPMLQAYLTALDTTSLANTVELPGSKPVTNLAVLASAVPELTVPCSVLLIPFGTTYVIAGRIRVPA